MQNLGKKPKKENSQKYFDAHEFGRVLREQRKRRGFKSLDAFSEAIDIKTDHTITISTSALQRIESGEQAVTLAQFVALFVTITGGLPYWGIINEYGAPQNAFECSSPDKLISTSDEAYRQQARFAVDRLRDAIAEFEDAVL